MHGYHVQITARSDSDLEPESIIRKVADASGAKYSAGSAAGGVTQGPPPVKSKPVFTPTSSSAGRSVNPLVAARSKRDDNVDEGGWGADAPPVTRDQIEKVASAYQPTKVNMAELTKQKQEPSRFTGANRQVDESGDVVKGGYQPIGKVDIAAIRAQSQKQNDDRPTPVKGAYEPIGIVDIGAIRAKAQKSVEEAPEPRSLSDRASAFSQPTQSERITSLPKPKVASKFGGASAFTGTKAPTPSALGFGTSAAPAAPPVGAASRTFADQGGKTPAQVWAEKKAKERGVDTGSPSAPSVPTPAISQKSGNEWKSGYTGKSWAPVQIGSAALRDRFKNTAPIGAAPLPSTTRAVEDERSPSPPPPVPDSSRPSGGFALPGLPTRPPPPNEEEDEEDPSAYEPEPEREHSPVRIAAPVSRGPVPIMAKADELPTPPPVALSQIEVPKEEDLPDELEADQAARAASTAVAEQTFEPTKLASGLAGSEGKRAVIQYDYEKAEDNEIDLIEGDYVTNIDMVDEDWWMGTNSRGESGLFPSNYVELVDDENDEGSSPAPPQLPPVSREPEPVASAVPTHPAAATAGPTATALYDYEAAEDNGE